MCTCCFVPSVYSYSGMVLLLSHSLQGEGKQSGETVLANFFNSLLSKKQAGGGKSGGRTAASAELDKLQSRR